MNEQQVLPAAEPHADRFRIAIAVLSGVAIIAVALAIAIAARGNHRVPSPPWSTWAPTSDGTSDVQQIADHIAPYYRVTAAQQLDVITPIQMTSADSTGQISGSGVTVALSTASSSSGQQTLSLLNGRTVAYNLCGTGGTSNCSLPTSSTQLQLLLRREALELTLYTLRYIGNVQNVVTVLPPGQAVTSTTSTLSRTKPSNGKSSSSAAKPVTVALLFDRTELQPWLQTPLSHTLATYPPSPSELSLWSQTEEAGLVDQLTAHSLFSEHLESQQEGGNLLVLNPLPAQ